MYFTRPKGLYCHGEHFSRLCHHADSD
jgi:hypothetical protein